MLFLLVFHVTSVISILSTRFAIWLLCAGAIALACGPSVRSTDSTMADTTSSNSTADGESAKQSGGSDLATSLDVSVKDGVIFTLHVTNTTPKQIELNFGSGQTYDFVVLDAVGNPVWKWGDGQMFTQALRNKLLAPSETITFQERWTSPSTKGKFTVVASLTSSNLPLGERAEFTLP